MKKRDQILITALKLFNDKGSHKVTTNHIAEAMAISPGNLYYHFKNKEHIIRELLEQLIHGFESLMRWEGKPDDFPERLVLVMKASSRLIYAYRFIYIELASLLSRDPEFRERYRGIKKKRAVEFTALFELGIQLDIFNRPIPPEERDAVFFMMWTYVEGLITSLQTSSIPVTEDSILHHFKHIFYMPKTYIKPRTWTAFSGKLGL